MTASARTLAVVFALAAITVAWAALPLPSSVMGTLLLTGSALAAVASVLGLSVQGVTLTRPAAESAAERARRYLVTAVRQLPWAEVLVIGTLLLEAEHAARPWHTGALLLALLGYLLTVHLAETGAAARSLRAQLPPLAAGLGLAVLAIAAGLLPGVPAGPAGTTLRIAAAVAAVAAGAAVLPTWLSGSR